MPAWGYPDLNPQGPFFAAYRAVPACPAKRVEPRGYVPRFIHQRALHHSPLLSSYSPSLYLPPSHLPSLSTSQCPFRLRRSAAVSQSVIPSRWHQPALSFITPRHDPSTTSPHGDDGPTFLAASRLTHLLTAPDPRAQADIPQLAPVTSVRLPSWISTCCCGLIDT